MAVLIDVNNKPIGKQVNDPPPPNSPDREILRVLRITETAIRTGLAETCATLQSIHETGAWNLTIDGELADSQAECVIIMRLRRDANNKIQQRPERWLALGKGFVPALNLLKEESQKDGQQLQS